MKRIILLLLSLLLFTSCVSPKNTDRDVEYYLNQIYNYEVKEKNRNNTVDNEEFEKYLDDYFLDTVSKDYLYMHSNIKDYKSLGIEKPEVSWGEVEYDSSSDVEELVNDLESLKEFDYDSLSYREQYYYDMFEYSILESIVNACYAHYDTPFSEGTDVLSNVVVTLDEFKITDKEYVDDYMLILADTDRYLKDMCEYVTLQAKDGIYHTDASIDYSVDYAESFVSKVEDNALITSFENRIAKCDFLSESEKEEYIKENRDTVINEIIPAFEEVAKLLESYRGKLDDDDAKLCNIDKNYAKATYLLKTSSNKDIDDIYEMGVDKLVDLWNMIVRGLQDEEAKNEFYGVAYGETKEGAFGLNDEETLEYLEENAKDTFPIPENIEYSISRLDASSASDSIIAYFVSPQLDDLDNNVIRTNPNSMGNDPINDYMVIAHEGIPGHMFENYYYQLTDPNRFTATQSFIGYTEGYASYVMLEAFSFSGLENENAILMAKALCIYGYIFDSVCDIGVNIYGWNKEDVEEFMEEYYIYQYDDSTVEAIYSSALSRPGTLVSYGIGYILFDNLRNKAESELGDKFDEYSYHEALIEMGPLPLVMLEDKIDNYIEENK